MKAGLLGSALTFAMASCSVPSAFGLAALSNPTWLSEICKNVNELAAVAASAWTQQAERLGNAARNRPENAGAGPEHAFESVTTADAVFVIIVIIRHVVFTPGGSPSIGPDK